MTNSVLIVDDEPDIRELLEITLGRMSLMTSSAADLESARALLSSQHFNLCLTDMRLPDGDGLELVEYIQREHNQLPVAVITAHGTTESAVKALKSGAFDFVSKPVNLQKLRDLVNSALRLPQSEPQQDPVAIEIDEQADPTITGQSSKVKALKQQIAKVARSQAPIYISGESGSGKELAARAIHQHSSRANGPFIAVNCGAIPESLVESELFGHLKGSFTGADQDKLGLFQAAHGGTLFLDEIADLPPQTQVKLLRVIQEKAIRPVGSQEEQTIDVRIVSATHKDLASEVEAGRLRQDLYFRINVIEVAVPSLRDRKEDIAELTQDILQKIASENDSIACKLTDDALNALQEYTFPGNVRELENILQRAATLCEDNTIQLENLEFKSLPGSADPVLDSTEPPVATSDTEIDITDDFSLEKHLESIEKEAIVKVLEETRWNKTAAAKKLGISFRSFRYRLKKLGLD